MQAEGTPESKHGKPEWNTSSPKKKLFSIKYRHRLKTRLQTSNDSNSLEEGDNINSN